MQTKEVTNYLLAHKNMKIIQRKDMFNFSLDTVLLANFCSITKDTKEIVDFGTNNAAIPLLLTTRTDRHITGVEIQPEAVELAKKNVEINNLTNQIDIYNEDIKDYILHSDKVHLVICNPPFFKVDEKSNLNENEYLRIARHEIKINLQEIISSAATILDNKGKLAIIHRPDRMLDIISNMQKNDIEPKRIRFVYPKEGRECNMLLIEGVYKGKKGLKILPPLYAHNEYGSYSKEVKKMFGEIIDE